MFASRNALTGMRWIPIETFSAAQDYALNLGRNALTGMRWIPIRGGDGGPLHRRAVVVMPLRA